MFKVIVSGTVLAESDDELCAYAIRNCYKAVGWTDVKVRGPRKKKVRK